MIGSLLARIGSSNNPTMRNPIMRDNWEKNKTPNIVRTSSTVLGLFFYLHTRRASDIKKTVGRLSYVSLPVSLTDVLTRPMLYRLIQHNLNQLVSTSSPPESCLLQVCVSRDDPTRSRGMSRSSEPCLRKTLPFFFNQ